MRLGGYYNRFVCVLICDGMRCDFCLQKMRAFFDVIFAYLPKASKFLLE